MLQVCQSSLPTKPHLQSCLLLQQLLIWLMRACMFDWRQQSIKTKRQERTETNYWDITLQSLGQHFLDKGRLCFAFHWARIFLAKSKQSFFFCLFVFVPIVDVKNNRREEDQREQGAFFLVYNAVNVLEQNWVQLCEFRVQWNLSFYPHKLLWGTDT